LYGRVYILKEEVNSIKKTYIVFMILFIVFCMFTIVYSEETNKNELDELDELDSLMKTDVKINSDSENTSNDKSELSNLFGQFSKNLDLDIAVNSSYFFESMPGYDDYSMEVRSKFSSWAGDPKHSFHFSGWLEIGSQKDTYSGITKFFRDEDRKRRIIEINEIYGILDLGEVEMTVGKKVLSPDTNSLYPLSGFYHSLDLNVPVEPRILGLWQVRADATIKETNFTAYLFPVFQDHKIPGSKSRWMTNKKYNQYWFNDEFELSSYFDFLRSYLLYYFGDIFELDKTLKDLLDNKTVLIENDLPEFKLEEIGYGGKAKTSLGKFDIFGTAYFGPNPYPVVKIVDKGNYMSVQKKNPPVWRLATGGTATWRDFEFHTEIMYNSAINNTDDDYISYTGGLTYSSETLSSFMGIDLIQSRIDYAGEQITKDQNHEGYYFSSREIRQFTNDILFQLVMQINDDTNAIYFLDASLAYNAWHHRISGSYRLYPGLVAECFVELFDGDDQSFIGRWKDNNRIGLKLTWTF
jgi:hypothetical protein